MSSISTIPNFCLVAILLSSAATAQSLPAGCDAGELATVPLTFTDDLRPIAEATIDGNVVPAMVNLGSAQPLVLNKKTLDRLGIKVRHISSSQFRSDADSADSSAPTTNRVVNDALSAFIKDFSVGRYKGESTWYLVEDFMDETYGVRVGAGSLLKTDLEVALDAGYLKYFKPEGCFTAHLATWDPKATMVPLRADLWKRDPRPVFSVNINGQDVSAILSTATPHSYLPKATGQRLGLTSTTAGATRKEPVPGHGEDKPVWNVPVAQMTIGALEVKAFDIRVMDLPHSGEILVLGADFLHRHRVYIAMSQRQVYFSALTPQVLKRGSVEVIPQPIK